VKRRFCMVLALLPVGLLFGSRANCQQTTPGPFASMDADVPNAPSSTQATTCTEKDGKPCSQRLHKLIGQYPPLPESRTKQPDRDPSSVHFWTYRGADEPALRTNKQVFHSKVFLAAHIGGAIAMTMACRTKGSGYAWESQAPAVGAILGLDYIQFRFIGGPNAIGPPIYEMIHYGLASTR